MNVIWSLEPHCVIATGITVNIESPEAFGSRGSLSFERAKLFVMMKERFALFRTRLGQRPAVLASPA